MDRTYICIDLKSYYASVECVYRGLDPLKANLLVADPTRSDQTICLAVSPSLKAIGVPSRPRLFEAKQAIRMYEAQHHTKVEYIIAVPRMAEYERISAKIYGIYLHYVAPEDVHPCLHATVPKHKKQEREIWTAETLFHATEVCEDKRLRLAINLAFACSLRIGELLGLTWDCVDISDEAINTGYACISVNKELQRVTRAALQSLENKDVMQIFPAKTSRTSTVLVLKTPKTAGSNRKIFLPKTVANMLIEWKKEQDFTIEALGSEYQDYNLVMAGPIGLPVEPATIKSSLNKLIEEHDLPKVVFHSLRHSSITYKLKLNGGDIKAVQGDSGHTQTSMVTDVYSHILDDDRRKNAQLFENAFYEGKGADPAAPAKDPDPEEQKASDMDTLMRLLGNPETASLLKQLVKAMDK